uniref:Uncharacterized protein n=1 Tax=Siphoviridae sp. ctOyJ30 TaxID=2826317 RepID=A0A8S5NE33_9CAUD|nr:MAG TPA: hypothetical protein [Siphoviridae sp. ctOyJ30]
MRIWIDGITRDMTAEEIAAMQESQLNAERITEPLTDSEKIALMLAAIPEEPVPTLEPKVGYKWKPVYSSSAGFAWELVEDPDALGTLKNPLRWTEGHEVKAGYHYTDGTHLYVALEDGVPTGIEDETYFAEV